MASKSKTSKSTAKSSKSKTSILRDAEDQKGKYRVYTKETSILVNADNEKEAKQTGYVLLLQKGMYSAKNLPEVTEVKELE